MDYKKQRLLNVLNNHGLTEEDLRSCLELNDSQLQQRLTRWNWRVSELGKIQKLLAVPFVCIEKLLVHPEAEDALTLNGCLYPVSPIDFTEEVTLDNGQKLRKRIRIDFEAVV